MYTFGKLTYYIPCYQGVAIKKLKTNPMHLNQTAPHVEQIP